MIVHDCRQGSKEWHRLRLGVPTSSCFDSVLTNKTLRPSASIDGYATYLLTEWALGVPIESGGSGWTDRGLDLEEQGRIAYEFENGRTVRQTGFVTTDDGRVGCSPDGLVVDGEQVIGGLELKHPSAVKHISYLLDPDSLVAEYRHQLQGSLWVTGLPWWEIRSGHAGAEPLPPVLVRVEPEPEWQSAFDEAIETLLVRLEEGKARLRDLGVDR